MNKRTHDAMIRRIDKSLVEAKDEYTCFIQDHGKQGKVFVLYHKPSNHYCAMRDDGLNMENFERCFDYLSRMPIPAQLDSNQESANE